MAKIYDGGTAFPTTPGHVGKPQAGMSLRAWMLGQVLPAFMQETHVTTAQEVMDRSKNVVDSALEIVDEALKKLSE